MGVAKGVDYEKTSSIIDELEEVMCWVRLMPYPLIEYENISKKISEELTDNLKSMGVKAKNCYTPGEYGSSRINFWYELVSLLKEFKVVKAVFLAGKFVNSGMEKLVDARYRSTNIDVSINLAVATKLYADDYPEDDVRLRLTSMFRMAYVEAKRLSAKYPLYTFNTRITMDFEANNFKAAFHIRNCADKYEYEKLCNIANKIKLVDGVLFNFSKAKWKIFKHSILKQTLIVDSKHRKPDYRYVDDVKNYYTILSDKFIGEYQKNDKEMAWSEFEKRITNQ